jgi:membrane associated rhomboid family serine protease
LSLFLAWLATSLFNSHFQTFAEAHLIGLVLGVLLASEMPPYGWGVGDAAKLEATSVATAS